SRRAPGNDCNRSDAPCVDVARRKEPRVDRGRDSELLLVRTIDVLLTARPARGARGARRDGPSRAAHHAHPECPTNSWTGNGSRGRAACQQTEDAEFPDTIDAKHSNRPTYILKVKYWSFLLRVNGNRRIM